MSKPKDPNQVLAEKIQNELVLENLVSKDNKDFLSKLTEGKLKENDWRTALLDKIHRKK
jgi:hypothetical protein